MSAPSTREPNAGPMWALGPYWLESMLSRGGMGEVWRATHRDQRVPVAIKVLTADRAREERFRRALRGEVRAVAKLSHANIARILDHGEVPEGLPEPFRPDSPYLVFELVEGGSLRPLCGRLSWDAIVWVLHALLDALAHAHARGLIHRDLKPENVLLGRRTASIKLTDFGLAITVEAPQEGRTLSRFAGTPAYMAPEQVEGRWRDYGPWTDLYGLGCLAYALATGNPPFSGKGMLDVLNGHLYGPVPPLVSRFDLPAGFESWVLALLEKDPAHRFQRAADAATALRLLSGEEAAPPLVPTELFDSTTEETASDFRSWVEGPGARRSRPASPPSLPVPRSSSRYSRSWSDTWSDTWEDVYHRPALGAGPLYPATAAPLDEGPTQPVRLGRPPPLPPSWRRGEQDGDEPGDGPLALRGVGLGLFGLRVLPMVGREVERDALWAALQEVWRAGSARAVLLTGPEGVGKSRLAGWLCERAEELGVANALRATFSPGGGPADGFAAMLERHLRSAGLSRADVLARVTERLRAEGVADADERHALTELIRPATAEEIQAGARPIRFGSPTERHALVRRTLERFAGERPLVVWLDDAGFSHEALAFSRQLLEAQDWEPSPILLVLTAADSPGGGLDLLAPLLALPEVTRLAVGPLPPAAHSALVRDLLALEGELALQVEASTAGNPQFAVQLVGHWVLRGLLTPGERGFRLAPGEALVLPEGLMRVWEERVARLLEGVPEREAASLELAAVLGQDVSAAEWAEARAVRGLPAVPALVDAMEAQGLAWPSDGGVEMGWSFAHGAVRSALEARAAAAGRLADHHRAAATMLAARVGPDALERRARHYLAAEDTPLALPALLAAIQARIATGDYVRAGGLLGRWEQALASLEPPPSDPRRGQGALLAASLARLEGRLDEAVSRVERVAADAASFGWSAVSARAAWELARISWNRGEGERALRLGQEAEAQAAALGDDALRAECARDLGAMYAHRGEHARATSRLWEAQRAFEAIGDRVGQAYALLSLGQIAQRLDRLDEAERCFQRALRRFREAGSRRGVADCDNSLGELARLRGDLVGAEASYRAARAGFQAIGSGLVVAPEANLGLVLVDRGRYAEAREVLEGALALTRRQGRRVIEGSVHAYLLPTLAGVRDWAAFEQHRAAAEALLAESGLVEEDVARMAETAGQLAQDASRPDVARAAFSLAVRQWERLGRTMEATRARVALARQPESLSGSRKGRGR